MNTLEIMKEHLQWNKGDVTTISAMADLTEELGENAEKLRMAAKCAHVIRDAEDKIREIELQVTLKLKKLKEAVFNARKICPHPVTKYYPDASGNNDSTTVCLCCGADI